MISIAAEPRRRLELGHVSVPETAEALRLEVRAFLAEAVARGEFVPRCDAWLRGFSPSFSRTLGERGWIGMTWSKDYGGHERSPLERFVVLEELLAAGAPVAAHWIADRQSGPQIFRHGSEEARRKILPPLARGECFISLGMSEPESGSDLASVQTVAERVEGGWRVTGTKIWTSHAHLSHYITVLCRTAEADVPNRHALSVLIVDLAADGVEVLPIALLDGERHFNEVVLQDVFVPETMLLGRENDGWSLVTSELSLERSGPERILSTFPLFREVVRRAAAVPAVSVPIGLLAAELWILRRLSLAVAAEISAGRDPVAEAALVKDMGTDFEQRVVEVARLVSVQGPNGPADELFARLLVEAVLAAPGFTLRGGTTEILRSVVARALGVAV